MAFLARMFCRLWRCPPPGRGRREGTAEKAEPSGTRENLSDDLTAIRGIGIAIQNRLYAAGIKSYAELARASSEDVREIVGKLAPEAKVEDWIAEAEGLAKGKEDWTLSPLTYAARASSGSTLI